MLHLPLVLGQFFPLVAEHGIERMLLYFIVFYLPFTAQTLLAGQSLPTLTGQQPGRLSVSPSRFQD